jgi:hypothetical protein
MVNALAGKRIANLIIVRRNGLQSGGVHAKNLPPSVLIRVHLAQRFLVE